MSGQVKPQPITLRDQSRNGRPKPTQSLAPWLLLAPSLGLILVFIAYPVGTVFWYSTQEYNVSKPWANEFVGLANFAHMIFHDQMFWRSLGVTSMWVFVEVGLQLVLGLGVALLLNRTFRGRGLARAIAFAPWAISGVLTTQIFLLIYNPSTGVASVLSSLGIPSEFSPLTSSVSAFWAVVFAELWRGLPFFAIMLLADLQTIPRDVYEAAEVDGANSWKRFRYITLPYLRNSILIITLLRAVWEFNNVDLIYTLTAGGPAGATTTLPLYIVNEAVGARNFGYGSALTVAGFVILAAFSVLYLLASRSRREADAR